ncbi:hypothetical protein ACJRO7_020370 [Eucalyptus globulus]|uniref:PRA1 family protein n=1 Tax=Eucalyptus globulus TaxID=34317 RepID=A0ABD3KLC0_EUCGL
MSDHGITHRPSSISSSTPLMETPHKPKVKSLNNAKLAFLFNLPATPEVAATWIIKNLCHFGLFYVLVLWAGLSISLVLKCKVSLLLLIATTIITKQYLMMLQLMPKACVHRAFDKMAILVLMAIVTTVGLILTQAAVHLFATLWIGLPVILAHSVLWRDGLFVNEEVSASASAPGELASLGDNVYFI